MLPDQSGEWRRPHTFAAWWYPVPGIAPVGDDASYLGALQQELGHVFS